MRLNTLEDFEKYVFKNSVGVMWTCKIKAGIIWFSYIKSPDKEKVWYSNLPSPPSLRALEQHIMCNREEYQNINPVHAKIRSLEQRFKERVKV